MAKLGVITDGISRDFPYALEVMKEHGLQYAELQFLHKKEVGDLDAKQLKETQALINDFDLKVSAISRHNFAGRSVFDVEVGDAWYQGHMEKLKRCIEMAQLLDAPIVRTMSFKKEMIIFGDNGAEEWNVANGAWDKTVELFRPIVELAQQENITLAVETGNNAIITSTALGKKLIDDLGTNHLKIMWDPANSLFCHENPTEALKNLEGGYLGHVHMKDINVFIEQARISNCPLGQGQMAQHLPAIAQWLEENYDGAISLESVYRPQGGSFEEGFRSSINIFKNQFAGIKQTEMA